MAPVRWPALPWRALMGAAVAVILATPPARALRIIDYNILNYPGSTEATRDPLFRTILGPLSPDIMVTEETNSQSGVTEFLNSVLHLSAPGIHSQTARLAVLR